jgi:hypothetical protein
LEEKLRVISTWDARLNASSCTSGRALLKNTLINVSRLKPQPFKRFIQKHEKLEKIAEKEFSKVSSKSRMYLKLIKQSNNISKYSKI